MNQEELATKSREELVQIAAKLNIKTHHKAKAETIIHQIMQQPVAYRTDAMKHPGEIPAAPVHNHTQDEILEVIKPYASKQGYHVEFPVDPVTGKHDGTWVFSFNGVVESGNCAIPMRVIKMKAESVARGKKALLGMPGARGQTYSDTVLA